MSFRRKTGCSALGITSYQNFIHISLKSSFQDVECFVVKLLILRTFCNIVLLDFRSSVYQVRCRHFESAFYEEVKLYTSLKTRKSLNLIMPVSESDEVSCVCGASCRNLECSVSKK
jgi:hypothetical protein